MFTTKRKKKEQVDYIEMYIIDITKQYTLHTFIFLYVTQN